MEEIERPKTSRRPRAAAAAGGASTPDGAPAAKPARRGAASKGGADATAVPIEEYPPPVRTSVPRSRAPVAAKPDPVSAVVDPGATDIPLRDGAVASPAATVPAEPHDPPAHEREPTPVAAPRPAAAEPASETTEASAKIPSFARKPEPPRPLPAATARPADTAKRPGQVLDWLLGRLPSRHRGRVHDSLVLMRMDRPIGALLLLWPTWWALWFAANDFPPLGTLFIFTLGVFVMRSAGCVINDYADHGWLDAKVERTAGRPMAAGRVSKKHALTLFGGLLALAFVLVLFTNALTIQLSFVGAALAAIYPFTKRVTHLAQVVLGAAFGWSIPMAFAAVTHSLPPLCWLLFLANILFSTIYDTEYAMVDRDEDIRAGAKSTAILFGDADRAIIGVLMATFLFAMLLAGTRAQLAWPYFVGLAGAAGLFAYQQWLIRARDRTACFAAFRNNNWVGLALWVGLVLALALR